MVKDTKRHRMNEFSYYVYIYIYICLCVCVRVGEWVPPPCLCLRSSSTRVHEGLYRSMRLSACIPVRVFLCPFPFKGSEEASRASLIKCKQLLRTPSPSCLTKAQTSMCGDEEAEKKCASPEKGRRRATERQQQSPQRAKQTAARVSVAHLRRKTAGKKKGVRKVNIQNEIRLACT